MPRDGVKSASLSPDGHSDMSATRRKKADPDEYVQDPVERRTIQNRVAQRNFRMRKDNRIKELELQLSLLTESRAHPAVKIDASESVNQPDNTMAEKIAQLEKRVRELEEENQALKRIKVPDVASPNTPISAYPTSNSFHPQQQHSYPSYPMYAYPPPPPPYPYYYPHPPPHSIPQHAPVMPQWAQPLQPMIPSNMWSAGHPPTTVPAPLPPNTLSSSTSSIALAPIPTPVLQKFESPDLVSPAAERPSGHPSSSGAPPSAM